MPPLVSEGGGLVCESIGKADLLSDHFDSKQSREAVDRPLTCHPSRTYPEWPHRQCVGLVFRRSHDRGSLSAASRVICSPARITVCNTWSSGCTALCRIGGATSQLDPPYLTPVSVAGCG